jgi:hypothetical protein
MTMVKRWNCILEGGDDNPWPEMDEQSKGDYVLYSDYLKICEALKEALDYWERDYEYPERLAKLRSQFL